MLKIKVKRIHSDALLPIISYEGDAGLDLSSISDYTVNPGERCLVKTGIAIELPKNTEAQVRPRSGLALKYGITVLNSPGTIDEQYRGEIAVIIINHGNETCQIKKHDRIAQLIINRLPKIEIIEVKELSITTRGEGGFGSSGIKPQENLI